MCIKFTHITGYGTDCSFCCIADFKILRSRLTNMFCVYNHIQNRLRRSLWVSVIVAGPSVTTLAAPIVPFVDEYFKSLRFEFTATDSPFLFFVSGDTTRNVSSSQWSSEVKAAFQFFCGIACSPKLLVRLSDIKPSVFKYF